jgi:hypothetical protein
MSEPTAPQSYFLAWIAVRTQHKSGSGVLLCQQNEGAHDPVS